MKSVRFIGSALSVFALFFSYVGYCDQTSFPASLLAQKQALAQKNASRLKQYSALIVSKLEALKPNEIDSKVHIVQSFFGSGGYEEKGDAAQLGVDGGVIRIDGFAPDRAEISKYMAAIRSSHLGEVKLNLLRAEMLDGKPSIAFGIEVHVGPIGPDTQTVFEKFIPVTPEIYVLDTVQFRPCKGPEVPKGGARIGLDEDAFTRRRLGEVQLASNLRVFVDELILPASIEYELTDVKSGKTIPKVKGGQFGASALRFTGSGIVYVTGQGCRGQGTRKFVLQGDKLIEVSQPLLFIGENSRLAGNVKLFLEPEGKQEIATLESGTVVMVIGRSPKNPNVVLVSTPLGLTGWLIEWGQSGGNLMMDACS